MEQLFHPAMELRDINAISALGLAHMGDCVFELLVRTSLCEELISTSKNLHRETVLRVSAPAQARRMERMLPLLTEEELCIYKRGRNTHPHGVPKNATVGEYAKATGLECLFGALYLLGKTARLEELFLATAEDAHAI